MLVGLLKRIFNQISPFKGGHLGSNVGQWLVAAPLLLGLGMAIFDGGASGFLMGVLDDWGLDAIEHITDENVLRTPALNQA